jgi:hypothetical protein
MMLASRTASRTSSRIPSRYASRAGAGRPPRIRGAWLPLIAVFTALCLAFCMGADAQGAASKTSRTSSKTSSKTASKSPSKTSKSAKPSTGQMTWKAIKPAQSTGSVCVRASGQQATYYKLGPKKAAELTVYGPSRLRIVTRHLPVKGSLAKRTYTLVVMRDGKVALRKPIVRGASKATLCKNKKTKVGAIRESFISIPAGKHTYRVLVEEGGKEVVARFYQEKRTTVASKMIGFTPLEFDEVCTIGANGAKGGAPWYRATFAKPVRFSVQGPVELEIRTRLDLGPAVAGPMRYGVEILRNGKSESVRNFSATRDAKASYKDCPGVTPGESKLIRLSVPAGDTAYEIRPAGTGAQSFAVRILIPRGSVGVKTR